MDGERCPDGNVSTMNVPESGFTIYGTQAAKREHKECGGELPGFKRICGTQAANFINDALFLGQRQRGDSSTGEEPEQSPTLRDGQGGTGVGRDTQNDGILVQRILRVPRDQGVVRLHRDTLTVNYLPPGAKQS